MNRHTSLRVFAISLVGHMSGGRPGAVERRGDKAGHKPSIS